MRIVIVPDTLADAINAKLEAAYLLVPDAAKERANHFHVLLDYYNEHGVLPDFSLVKKT
jgi:hypothetical protein